MNGFEMILPFPSLPYCPPTITSTSLEYSRANSPRCVAAFTSTSSGVQALVSITTSAFFSNS